MRKLLLMGLCLLAGMARAEDFTAIMTPEDRAATGIDRLTPAELARLKAVVERYKSGEVAVVRQEAEQKVAAVKQEAEQKVATVKQEAEQKVAVAEAKVQQVEAQQTIVAEKPGDKKPGWFGALVTLQKAGEKGDKAEVMEGRLAGNLRSFSGIRSFELEDGQVWRMTEGGSYHGPEVKKPAVRITPGFLGTYWLQIREAPLRVKVAPVKLP